MDKEWPNVGDVCLIRRRQDEQATRYVIRGVMRNAGQLVCVVLTDGVEGAEPTRIDWADVEAITNPAP